MRFDPTAKEEPKEKEFATWPDGEYDAVVMEAEECMSSKNNPQIKITLDVFDDANGRKQKVWDYLSQVAVWKIEQFMNCCGLTDEFMSGDLDPTASIGKNIRVKLQTQPASNGYKAKNTVKNYVFDNKEEKPKAKAKPTGVPVAQTKAANKLASDDEIPFGLVGPLIGLLASSLAMFA